MQFKTSDFHKLFHLCKFIVCSSTSHLIVVYVKMVERIERRTYVRTFIVPSAAASLAVSLIHARVALEGLAECMQSAPYKTKKVKAESGVE